MAMGQNPKKVPPLNVPIPTKIKFKMGGEFTYPKMVSLVLTRSHILSHSQFAFQRMVLSPVKSPFRSWAPQKPCDTKCMLQLEAFAPRCLPSPSRCKAPATQTRWAGSFPRQGGHRAAFSVRFTSPSLSRREGVKHCRPPPPLPKKRRNENAAPASASRSQE